MKDISYSQNILLRWSSYIEAVQEKVFGGDSLFAVYLLLFQAFWDVFKASVVGGCDLLMIEY